MTPTEAKQVIEALAKGIDPESGEVLPAESPVNSPHVIRALFLAAKALDLPAAKREQTQKPAPAQAGKAWTADEDQQLAQAFDAGAAVSDIARAHHRTNGAITSRLVRLGRLLPAKAPSRELPADKTPPHGTNLP